MRPLPVRSFHWLWVALMLAAALWLRAWNLHSPVLFIDEAESAINAMTILQHGAPRGEYLGLPIYENTLVQPWPDHPEYEFRDVSYSERGLAIYHGWLPLYAIAGSYRLAGVRPDEPIDPPAVQTDERQMLRRTVAARAPAVVFGMLFVIAAYVAGRRMAGPDAALVALTLAALAPPAIRVARQARYYAPTHLLSLLCCLSVLLMWRNGRWRDFIFGAVAFALLFHTHVISFLIACVVVALVMPLMRHHPHVWRKLSLFALLVGLAVVPWVAWTGFPGQAGLIPSARSLMLLEDWIAYLTRHWKFALVLGGGAAWLATVFLLRRRLPQRITQPFLAPRHALLLLMSWMLIGYVGFLLLAPASSAFLWRLTLGVQGPGILFVAILAAAAVHVAFPPRSSADAPDARGAPSPAGTAFAVAIGVALFMLPQVRGVTTPQPWRAAEYQLLDELRSRDLAPGTRIYATPLHHLTLTLLGDIPIQSTAPVRRRFFSEYPGDIVILETVSRADLIEIPELLAAAGAAGVELDETQAIHLQQRLATWRLRQSLVERGMAPAQPPEPLPDWQAELLAALPERTQEDPDGRWDNPAMFRGHETPDKWGFWQVFFYRFVDPASRMDSKLNYADRVRGAEAEVLESGWVVITAPPPNPPAATPDEYEGDRHQSRQRQGT